MNHQALAPEWKTAANKLKGIVRFGAVDCTVETGLAQRFGIQGYPSIKVFAASKPGIGKKGLQPVDYNGQRKAGDLVRYADEMVPPVKNLVTKFGSETEALQFFGGTFHPRILLFTNKDTTSTLFRMVAHMFSQHAQAIEVPQKFSKVFEAFQIKSAPTLVVLCSSYLSIVLAFLIICVLVSSMHPAIWSGHGQK